MKIAFAVFSNNDNMVGAPRLSADRTALLRRNRNGRLKETNEPEWRQSEALVLPATLGPGPWGPIPNYHYLKCIRRNANMVSIRRDLINPGDIRKLEFQKR